MRKTILALSILALVLFASCVTYKPVFVLTLHEFASASVATRLSKQVRNANRELQYTIRQSPFLDARCFCGGEVYGPNEDGFYGIRVNVDMWNIGVMHQMAGSNLGMVYAVVVDGTYIGTSHFTTEMRDGDVLVIEPLWNLYDATKIVEHFKDNQAHLNNWHTKPFRR